MLAIENLSRHLNTAVDALHKIAPERLQALAAREGGMYADLLKPNQGATLGAGDDRLVAEVWADALDAASAKLNARVQIALAALKTADILELATAIGAGISGSTLIALLSGGTGNKASHITVAGIGLACSIASIVVAYIRRTRLNSSRIDSCREAIKLTAEATILLLHLRSVSKASTPDEKLVERTEALLQKLLMHDL